MLPCQTLSKVFNKSGNTPPTSHDGFASNALSIITGLRKCHLGENLTDYSLKDYYGLSV